MTDKFSDFEGVDDWAIRSEFWKAEAAKLKNKKLKRERNSTPLILCGHGISLRIEHGALIIREGFTHYPQMQALHRFFPGSRETPERIILLDGSGTLSFEVLSWLAEQSVALARIRWTGEVSAVASGTGFSSDRAKVQWQQALSADQAGRISFAADLIRRKLLNCVETLEGCLAPSERRDSTIERHQQGAGRLATDRFSDVNDIRAIEGHLRIM